jgi:hypothetical protein
MDIQKQAKAILLYTFTGVYILTSLGTLAMVFLDFGNVPDSERSILINTFLTETAIAVFALFYSVWELKKKDDSTTRMIEQKLINPLASSFKDLIIPLENLKLPTVQLHKNKHFKGCTFVGPSSVVLSGGTISKNLFLECGEFIVLPKLKYLTGMLVFENCTIEDCTFSRVTIFADQSTALALKSIPGVTVAGLLI